MRRFTKYIFIVAVVSILLTLSSCVFEKVGMSQPGEELSVKFTLQLSMDFTRSITTAEESEILTIDVLAFVKNSSGEYVYTYKPTEVSRDEDNGIITVTAKVTEYSSEQQFVVLANASAELSAAGIIRGEELTSAMRKIVCAAGNGEYPTRINGTGAYKPIPMYAKTTPLVITPSTSSIGNYSMLRMVARVNVELSDAVNNFELVNAALYNYKKAGYVAYDFSNPNSSGNLVTTPAVPAAGAHSGDPIIEPTLFHGVDINGKIYNSIMTYESPAITSVDGKIKGTALVIGGYFGSNKTDMVYYRVDIKTTDDASANISSGILRNHSYNVIVQSVGAPGYDNPLDAYLGEKPIIFTVAVTTWGENVNVPLG